MRDRSTKFVVVASTLVLFLAGAAYLVRGVYFAVSLSADYQLRWTEQQYVFRGKNPSAIIFADRPNAQAHRGIPPDPDLGTAIGGYPPWAYFTGAAFAWPSNFATARWYFTAINLVLLAVLTVWTARLTWSTDPWWGLLFAAALLATSSVCTTLGLGQYGVVVLAALAGAYWFDEKNRWLLGGLLLGVAMVKVTLAGPFLLPFVLRRRWKTTIAALAYVGLGTLVIWPTINASPLVWMAELLGTAHFYVGDNSLMKLSVSGGLVPREAVGIAAGAAIAVALVVSYLWRQASMLTLFAVAGVAARFWTYHTHYDNLILIFLLLALGVHAIRHERRLAWAGFVAVGLSLWFPARLTDVAAYQTFQWVMWSAGLALLLILEWPGAKSVERPAGA